MNKRASQGKRVTVSQARAAARAVKERRGGRPYPVTGALWERYLGHFGPAVRESTKAKPRSAKKARSKKRAA